MSFFNSVAKGVNSVVNAASIPILKGQRNELEAQRTSLENEIDMLTRKKNESVKLVETLTRTQVEIKSSIGTLALFFSEIQFRPVSGEEELNNIDDPNKMHLNLLFDKLNDINEYIALVLKELAAYDDEIASHQKTINTLNAKIKEYNDKLWKIRSKEK